MISVSKVIDKNNNVYYSSKKNGKGKTKHLI